MKRIVLAALGIMLMLSFSGCDDDKNFQGLIEHLKKEGLQVSSRRGLAYGFLGAINGGKYTINNKVYVELYEWKDSGDVKMVEFENDRFGMTITNSKKTKYHDKVIDAFEDY